MRSSEWIYEAAVRAAVPALRLAAPLNDKLRRGIAGRRESVPSLQRWAAAERDAARPLLWLHAPSVGEALMAQAILAAAVAHAPDIQSIFTYFSPSAERVAPRVGADWHGYLPWDRADDVRAALDAAQPACVAFVRTEIWPIVVREAVARGCPVVLVNGVLASDSSRLGRGARMLLGDAYRRLDAVGAVSREDAAYFALLGIDRNRVHVTGDARFDQVWERVQSLDRNRPLLRPFRERGEWLVCGSTWPADEDMLIEALSAPRTWQAIVAPHEPSREHLERLEQRLTRAGLRHMRLPAEGDSHTGIDDELDVVVVDRVGVLADLYAIAAVAYVGGGFGSAGLHSIVEPAALSVPVVFGPRHGNAREAERLRQAGGGFVIADARLLASTLNRLFGDAASRSHAGSAARRFVERDLGGADAGAALILDAMRNR